MNTKKKYVILGVLEISPVDCILIGADGNVFPDVSSSGVAIYGQSSRAVHPLLPAQSTYLKHAKKTEKKTKKADLFAATKAGER